MSFGKNAISNIKNNKNNFSKVENSLEDLMNKNNMISEQFDLLINKRSTVDKDIEHFENLFKEIQNEISNIEEIIKNKNENDKNDMNSKYNRLINKEKESLKLNKRKFEEIKNNFYGSSGAEHNSKTDSKEQNPLNFDLDQYKVNKNEIKFMKDICREREEGIKNMNEQIHLVNKFSKDMAFITAKADVKINSIIDNVVPALDNVNDAHNLIVKTDKIEKDLKTNKCYILLLLVLSVVFLCYLIVLTK